MRSRARRITAARRNADVSCFHFAATRLMRLGKYTLSRFVGVKAAADAAAPPLIRWTRRRHRWAGGAQDSATRTSAGACGVSLPTSRRQRGPSRRAAAHYIASMARADIADAPHDYRSPHAKAAARKRGADDATGGKFTLPMPPMSARTARLRRYQQRARGSFHCYRLCRISPRLSMTDAPRARMRGEMPPRQRAPPHCGARMR